MAVIDLEFAGLTQAIAAGCLKKVIAAKDYTGQGMETGGGHGVACAEIITEVQLHQAVRDADADGDGLLDFMPGLNFNAFSVSLLGFPGTLASAPHVAGAALV